MQIIEELFKKYNFKDSSVGFTLIEKDDDCSANQVDNNENNIDCANKFKFINGLEENLFLLKSFKKIAKIGSWSWNIENGQVYRSNEIFNIFNLKEKVESLTFEDYLSYIPESERLEVKKVINNALKKGVDYELTHHIEIIKGDVRLIKEIGKAIFDENNKATKMIGIVQDITNDIKKNETIRDLSENDLLTGLPNWRVFRDRLKQMLSTRKNNEEVLLSVIKLLNLGDMNELKGSEAGDEILKEFALRIKSVLDVNITFARLEGTEFAILFKSEDSLREFDNIMEMITYSLKKKYFNKNHKEHFFNVVSGTVIAPTDGDSSDILMKNVISTLHKAKENKSHYFFSKDFKEKSSRRILLTNELRKEIKNFQYIKPYYQAKLDENGEILGAEALARWFHPEIGFIPPSEFIPIAEESGMISELGEFMFEETCRNISSHKNIPNNFKVAVNLSSVQLADKNLPDNIEKCLNKYSIDYKHIELEVTESMLQDNLSETIITLNKLRNMGATIALDDFGTGYSSLSYLKELPIDILKIDQSFIFSMLKSKKDQAIVDTIITLGKNLDMKLVAEGVETKEDVKTLTKKGCDYFQGYYFHKPSSWSDLSSLMDKTIQ